MGQMSITPPPTRCVLGLPIWVAGAGWLDGAMSQMTSDCLSRVGKDTVRSLDRAGATHASRSGNLIPSGTLAPRLDDKPIPLRRVRLHPLRDLGEAG